MAARRLTVDGYKLLYLKTKTGLLSSLKPFNINNACVASKQVTPSRCYSDDTDGEDYKPIQLQLFEDNYRRPIYEFRWVTSFVNKLIANYRHKGFSTKELFIGSTKAVDFITTCIAEGDLDSLEGLVEEETLDRLRQRYDALTDREKESIPLLHEDRVMKSIEQFEYKNDQESQGHVSYLFVAAAVRVSQAENPSTMLKACQYCFRRSLEPDADWIVTKLNHVVNEVSFKKMF